MGAFAGYEATNVHYRVSDVNVGITLSWNSGNEPNVINHPVYFGTGDNSVSFCNQSKPDIRERSK